MKIYIRPSTAGRYGGTLKGNLRHFDKYIQDTLLKNGFKSSFDDLTLTLAHPPLYVLPGATGAEKNFFKFYDELPDSRLERRAKKIFVNLQAPEFSEHFDLAEKSQHEHTFEIAQQYKDLTNTDLAKILIEKLLQAAELIKRKLKKEDLFDLTVFRQTLDSIKEEISTALLDKTSKEQTETFKNDQIEFAEQAREKRRHAEVPKDKLIRDIRLSFTYKIPPTLFYLNRYADIVLGQLIRKGFMCPVYHHLYIKIANTKEEALENILIAEDWYTFGIAVLPKEELFKADHATQQELVLKATEEGLLDIAELDKLDKPKIKEAIAEAKEIGVLGEVIFKAKENNKIAFVITTKTQLGKNTEEIFFTIIDKENDRLARWKFAEENIFLIGGWFGTITVTNKKIKTKPRANMGLVLEGKQTHLEIDVEKELSDPNKIIKAIKE
jgi:hypothetical protein